MRESDPGPEVPYESDTGGREPPAAAQLRRGFRWLRFEPALESAFLQDQHRNGLRGLRVNLGIALAMVLGFAFLNRSILPPAAESVMAVVRYGMLVPAIAIAFLATFLPGGHRTYRLAISLCAPVALLGIALLALTAWEFGQPRLFAAMILATTFSYFLLGLPFPGAVAAAVIAWVGWIVGSLTLDTPAGDVLYSSVTLLFAVLVGGVVAYNLEHARRESWLEAVLLSEMAQRDGLTGIFNRRRFDQHLTRVWPQAIREGRPVALLLADLDCFKAYNDRYGHQAGDEALSSVAAVMASYARRPLDIAARYGGEELALVLFDASREHARKTADGILAGVRALKIVHASSSAAPMLTVSIGLAYIVPSEGRSAGGLVQLADQALYMAKDGGRNRVQFLEREYEQLQTGYFHRKLFRDDRQ